MNIAQRLLCQQTQRWIKSVCFEAMAHDLRKVLRLLAGREAAPTAVIYDGRSLQSMPESGGRAGYDEYKRKKGSKVHAAVDTRGHLLALKVTPANEQERSSNAADPRTHSKIIREANGHVLKKFQNDLTRKVAVA